MSTHDLREDLRKRAQARASDRPLQISTTRSAEELAEELELHKTELEVQCQDLQEALADAQTTRDIYRQVYDFGPLPYILTDERAHIQGMNLAAASLLDLDERSVVSSPYAFQALVAEEDTNRFHLFLREARVSGQWTKCEVTLVRKTSDPVQTIVHAVPLKNSTGLLLAIIDISDRVSNERKLAESEKGLALELQKAHELQGICAALVRTSRVEELYEQIVRAATTLMDSQAASMQMLDSNSGKLKLLAWQGFHPASAAFWESVEMESGSSCGAALAAGHRVIVSDVEHCDFIVGTGDLEEYRRSQIRAVQSTPLVSRRGELLGMVSTHWSDRHTPSEAELRHFDVLARLAADLIDQKRAHQQLRQSEAWLSGQKEAFQAAMTGAPLQTSLGALIRTAVEHFHGKARAAFYLANHETATLSHIVGVSNVYAGNVDAFKIGEDALACGLAMHRGEAVITPDVNCDARWEPWRGLAQDHGYRGCWSFPVRTTEGPILGTFALYFSEPCQPAPRDFHLAGVLTHAATIIISLYREILDRARAEEALRESKSRLERFTEELERQVKARTAELLESQSHLRALATELHLAEQRERKRLAAELHDHLQQMLVLGKLTIGQAKRAAVGGVASENVLNKVDDLLGDALAYTRTLVADLSPPVLRDYGLAAGLKWLGESMKKHDLIVTVTVPEEPSRKLSEDHTVLVFQSVRELLINAAKHAGTGEATVEMAESNDRLEIVVRDKGGGFDPAAAADLHGSGASTGVSSKFGLFSIRERMHAIGGWFDITSESGKGTSATLALPLEALRESSRKVQDTTIPVPVHGKKAAELAGKETCTRVLLVDDHAMMRQGLRAILETYPDVQVVGDAADGLEALAAVDRLRPHVILMDINMPNRNGIEATADIKARYPDVQVIGLSVNGGNENQEAMLKAGASMLITKEAAVEQLYGALQEVVTRNHHI